MSFWASTWRVLSERVPLILRAAVVLVLARWVGRTLSDYTSQVSFYAGQGLDNPANAVLLFSLLEGLLLVMLAMGAAGRTMSVAGLILAGVKLQFETFNLDYWILIVAYMGLLFLGTGKFSLWQPEEPLVQRRAGEVSAT